MSPRPTLAELAHIRSVHVARINAAAIRTPWATREPIGMPSRLTSLGAWLYANGCRDQRCDGELRFGWSLDENGGYRDLAEGCEPSVEAGAREAAAILAGLPERIRVRADEAAIRVVMAAMDRRGNLIGKAA